MNKTKNFTEQKVADINQAAFAIRQANEGVIIQIRTGSGEWRDVGHPYVYKDYDAAVKDIERNRKVWVEAYKDNGRELLGIFYDDGTRLA